MQRDGKRFQKTEIEIPDGEDPDEYGYDELKEEILAQAERNDIPWWKLKFWLD